MSLVPSFHPATEQPAPTQGGLRTPRLTLLAPGLTSTGFLSLASTPCRAHTLRDGGDHARQHKFPRALRLSRNHHVSQRVAPAAGRAQQRRPPTPLPGPSSRRFVSHVLLTAVSPQSRAQSSGQRRPLQAERLMRRRGKGGGTQPLAGHAGAGWLGAPPPGISGSEDTALTEWRRQRGPSTVPKSSLHSPPCSQTLEEQGCDAFPLRL